MWQLTFYAPAAAAMGTSGVVAGLVDLARHSSKEKVGLSCWCSRHSGGEGQNPLVLLLERLLQTGAGMLQGPQRCLWASGLQVNTRCGLLAAQRRPFGGPMFQQNLRLGDTDPSPLCSGATRVRVQTLHRQG